MKAALGTIGTNVVMAQWTAPVTDASTLLASDGHAVRGKEIPRAVRIPSTKRIIVDQSRRLNAINHGDYDAQAIPCIHDMVRALACSKISYSDLFMLAGLQYAIVCPNLRFQLSTTTSDASSTLLLLFDAPLCFQNFALYNSCSHSSSNFASKLSC